MFYALDAYSAQFFWIYLVPKLPLNDHLQICNLLNLIYLSCKSNFAQVIQL